MNTYKSYVAKTTRWLDEQIEDNGAYAQQQDLACYYKSPLLFFLTGNAAKAHRLLDFMKTRFMQPDGDFVTASKLKSENGVFNECWPYINGWIAMSAHRMGQFDISFPAYNYLKQFYNPNLGGFNYSRPFGQGNDTIDTLATSHLGLVSLYFGDLAKARSAGDALEKIWLAQKSIRDHLLLRMTSDGKLVEAFSPDAAPLCLISTQQSNQAWFMVGYPVSFLSKLYQATDEKKYLELAQHYANFAISCKGNVRSFHFSHKLAWGSAILYNITQQNDYLTFAADIANHLVDIQNQEGYWHKDEPAHTHFDQSAEIALWLNEIEREIRV